MNILQKTTLAGVTVAMLILMGSGAAMAEPAAIIKDDGLCGMPGADANGNFIFGGWAGYSCRRKRQHHRLHVQGDRPYQSERPRSKL